MLLEYTISTWYRNLYLDPLLTLSLSLSLRCYERSVLYGSSETDSLGLARHYETGEPLPQEIFDKLCAARHHHGGMQMLRQLYFGQLDMDLHSQPWKGNKTPSAASSSSSTSESALDIQRSVAERFTVVPPLDDDRFLCAFSHIFAGYAAGYYSYVPQWGGEKAQRERETETGKHQKQFH